MLAGFSYSLNTKFFRIKKLITCDVLIKDFKQNLFFVRKFKQDAFFKGCILQLSSFSPSRPASDRCPNIGVTFSNNIRGIS